MITLQEATEAAKQDAAIEGWPMLVFFNVETENFDFGAVGAVHTVHRRFKPDHARFIVWPDGQQMKPTKNL